MALIFIRKYRGLNHLFRNYRVELAQAQFSDLNNQSFFNVLVAYLFGSGISKIREIIFKLYRVVYRFGKVETLLHRFAQVFKRQSGQTIKSLCSNRCHGCERL